MAGSVRVEGDWSLNMSRLGTPTVTPMAAEDIRPKEVHNVKWGERHEYTYIAATLFGDVPISELPLRNVTFSWNKNSPGTFSGDVQVPTFARARDFIHATSPGRTVIYILRDGYPLWGGIIWKRSFESNSRVIKIEADTFDSYMYHRILDQDISFLRDTTLKPPVEGTDQIHMFHTLWRHMSGTYTGDPTPFGGAIVMPERANCDIGVVLEDYPIITVRRGRTFSQWDFRTYGEHLESLAELRDGFEWICGVRAAPEGAQTVSGIERRINFAYPKFGRIYEETGFIWEYPGTILSYSWTADADKAATSVYILGSGEGTQRATAHHHNTQRLAEGWPLLDVSRTHSTVSQHDTMLSHAAKYLRALDPPLGDFQLTIHPDLFPRFGALGGDDYFIGDEITIKIDDEIFVNSDVRNEDLLIVIEGIEVNPGDNGLEEVKPTFSLKARNPYIPPEDETASDKNPEESSSTPPVDTTGSNSNAPAGQQQSVTVTSWHGGVPKKFQPGVVSLGIDDT